ncbi:restriction endonuclease subunit S [Mangrovimonas sp. YM274]|uniref:restriction endonuclease subunit S n=1 Tax=Mangrovimonas sp. YM274 TaxID=3070660 RepID=UPI0027DB624D|nr:restriction endonuclease subunit S [Mangrovimonas sp. YM274]WMI70071.1 restriction endonuclease subunit S [Mangrovimonas sp. YM274]
MILEKKIADVFTFIRNGVSIKQDSSSGGVPITRIETIASEKIDEKRVGYADLDYGNLGKYEGYLLKEGDILMSHINSPKHLGKSAIYEGSPRHLIHGMNLLCLRAKLEVCYPKYMSYYFASQNFKSDLMKISNQSVNQASFSAGNLKKLKIPLPDLETQKRIAQILEDAAALRDKTKELLGEYDKLAQSIFLDMFGDPVVNPKGWEKEQIQSLGKTITGNTPSRKIKEYYGDFIEWVKTDNINTPEMYLTSAMEYLSESGLRVGRSVNKGAILVTCIAGSRKVIGNVAVANRRVAFNQQINAFEPKNKISMFWYYQFVLAKPYVQNFSTNGMKGIITKGKFQLIKFINPPIDLQNQFADKIALIEQQKELAKQELKEAEDLFNCLLQKAFKGELV